MQHGLSSFKGIVRGNSIDLDRQVGLPDGQEVTVVIQPVNGGAGSQGEGLRSAFGAWKDDDPEGLDAFLEWNRQQRKQSRRELGE
jgi:hypothetical protein